MSYKDEYEVARLHTRTGFAEGLSRDFEGDFTVNYHLAPPFLPLGKDARGRPRKRRFGPWMGHAFGALARMKRVRGTVFDPFGYTDERRMERALIGWYEDLLESCPRAPMGEQHARWARILSAPMDIRGYGPVKSEAVDRVKGRGRRASGRKEERRPPGTGARRHRPISDRPDLTGRPFYAIVTRPRRCPAPRAIAP